MRFCKTLHDLQNSKGSSKINYANGNKLDGLYCSRETGITLTNKNGELVEYGPNKIGWNWEDGVASLPITPEFTQLLLNNPTLIRLDEVELEDGWSRYTVNSENTMCYITSGWLAGTDLFGRYEFRNVTTAEGATTFIGVQSSSYSMAKQEDGVKELSFVNADSGVYRVLFGLSEDGGVVRVGDSFEARRVNVTNTVGKMPYQPLGSTTKNFAETVGVSINGNTVDMEDQAFEWVFELDELPPSGTTLLSQTGGLPYRYNYIATTTSAGNIKGSVSNSSASIASSSETIGTLQIGTNTILWGYKDGKSYVTLNGEKTTPAELTIGTQASILRLARQGGGFTAVPMRITSFKDVSTDLL